MTGKERFCEILKATGRPGVDKVLAGLEELGFFAAPASLGKKIESGYPVRVGNLTFY